MPDPWKGYAAVNDDLRQTFERVFYGRQVTGNAMQADVASMAVQSDATASPATSAGTAWGPAGGETTSPMQALYGGDATHEERIATATAWEHAKNAPGARQEIATAEGHPYYYADAPALEARGAESRASLYGTPASSEGPAGTVQMADLYGHPADDRGPNGATSPASALYGPPAASQETTGTSQAADLYGPSSNVPSVDAGSVWGPAQGASPTSSVEPPNPAPAAPSNDMTPG